MNTRNKHVPAAVALLTLACNAGAQQHQAAAESARARTSWYTVATLPDILVLFDTARVDRVEEGHARVWYRFEYGTPLVVGNDTVTKYRAVEAREDLDCPQRRTRDIEMQMETVGGVRAGSLTPDAKWQSIDTHPFNSGVFLVGCRIIGYKIPVHPN